MQIGRIYEGRVTSIKDFGAFVEILPGKDGLCHISELSDEFVRSVGDVLKLGEIMQVKVIAIDDQDRVKLSRKQAIRELTGGAAPSGEGAAAATAMAQDTAIGPSEPTVAIVVIAAATVETAVIAATGAVAAIAEIGAMVASGAGVIKPPSADHARFQ